MTILKRIGIGLGLLVVLCLGALLWYRSASQPLIDGKLKLPGLQAPVEVVRDREGVPHIYAKSPADAYFALGFVHAQDRLWQLEMNRRIAAGRMAEILGPNALGIDRAVRTLGVRRNAEKILANLAPDTRTALNAYADGINAYLAQRHGPLPPEFHLTGAPSPAPWHPADSIAWQTMMAWDLGGNWTQELMRMRLAQQLTLEQINQFLPPYPGDAAIKTRDYTALYRDLAGTTEQLAAVEKIAPSSHVEGMGSNNWVVSGALSETGKPLLANDPHLALSVPSLWYLAHLSAPGLNAIGATLPGLPAIVLGHNDRIAWGFTNTAPDVQDLYIERIKPDDASQYQTPDGWAAFRTRTEIIKIKGQPDLGLTVRETRHGPVLSGALPLLDKAPVDARQYAISFAWTALRPDDLTTQAGIRFNRAANWREFVNAAKDFHSPQQSIVYADVDGNIGFLAPGRVPIRKKENDLHGLAPAPGWDARYDWDGFIPFECLPLQYNPASQRVITANHKIVSADYPYFLTSEWALPYRADRIAALIEATPRHTVRSFAKIQKDTMSLAAQELLPILHNVKPGSVRARAVLERLSKWQGAMDADRPEPLIFHAWTAEISRRIFADELGEPLMNDYWEQRSFHLPMLNVLKNAHGEGRWCADADVAVAAADCNALLTATLETALNRLERRYGNDLSTWRWGDAHVARSEHRPFGKVAPLAWLFDIRVPTPGDAFTVNVGRYSLRDGAEPFANRHAAGFRALYDLADLENSQFIHATGQSGNLLSPLYRNFSVRWANVDYLPMRTKREKVEQERSGLLILTP